MWTNCVRNREAATKICKNSGYTKNDYCQGGDTIRSSASGRCIDVPFASGDNGVQFQIYDCNNSNAQKFYRDDKGRIVNVNSGKCLEVSGGDSATANGTAVQQWTCHEGNNQKWDQDEIGRLRPRHASNKCLDIVGGGTGNGSRLHIWDCFDIPSQKWNIPDNCLGSKCWCQPETKTTTLFGSDYTPCFRDEDALAQGLSNKRDLASKWCRDQNAGYTGVSDERDCGDWYSSFKCSRPVWSNTGDRNTGTKDNWNQDGCRDQTFRYARRVDLKGANFNDGMNSMLTTVPTEGQTLFGEIVRSRGTEDLGVAGQWLVMNTSNSSCDPGWMEDWKDRGCSNGLRTYTRWVNAKQWSNWDAAAEYMRAQFMRESEGKFNGTQDIVSSEVVTEGSTRIVRIRVRDDGCGPRWSNGGSDLEESKWNKDGCKEDLGFRYARWVDPNGNTLETAVSQMLARLPAEGQSFLGKTVSSRTNEGNWIIIYTRDTACDPDWKDATWSNEGCRNDGNRGYNRWVDAKTWPVSRWQEAAEIVRNRFLGESGGKFNGTQTIISSSSTDRAGGGKNVSLVVEDSTCKPGWLNQWQDKGCEASISGFKRLERQVDAKSMDWTLAANMMSAPIQTVSTTTTAVVTFYADGDYQGTSYTRGVGNYSLSQLVTTVAVSSVKVPAGLAVVLYDGTLSFTGNKLVLVGPVDVSFLGDFNDKVRSAEIGIVKAKEISTAGGSFVIIRADFQNCYNYEPTPSRVQCININQSITQRKCINWPAGWIASNDIVTACQRLRPANSTVQISGTDVVARYQNNNDSFCRPYWENGATQLEKMNYNNISLWSDEGCQIDGSRRYSRGVDLNNIDQQTAINYMLNTLPQVGFPVFTSQYKLQRKESSGNRIVIYTDSDCFSYPGPVSNESCVAVGKRTRAQKCENWPVGWIASDEVVTACQAKKPAGSTPQIVPGGQVWAKWLADDVSCNPTWVKQGEIQNKSLWDDNGCQPNGTRRYAREVNTQGLPDNMTGTAMNYMLELLPKIDETLFNKTVKSRAVEGRWIIMFVDDGCQPDWEANSRWDDGICQADKTKRYLRPIDAKAWSDWDAAANFVRERELTLNGGRFNGTQEIVSSSITSIAGKRYVVFNVRDSNCEAGWLEEWQDKGCQENGDRKFSRQVRANSLDWDLAADTLLTTIEVGSQLLGGEVTSKNKVKTPSGVWIEITVNKRDCFNYPGEISRENCTAVGRRIIAKECQNWPAGWVASGNVVQACQANKPAGSTPQIAGTQVWAKWETPDESCNPTWSVQGDTQNKTLWRDDGCQTDGTHKYTRQVNTQGLDSISAGTYMLTLVPQPDENLFNLKVSRRAVEGDRIAMFLNEDCFDYSGVLSRETCAAVGKRTVAKECLNWPSGWTSVLNREQLLSSCETKKPAGSTVDVYGTQVWAKYQIDDESCTPTWAEQGNTQDINLWQDNGCQGDGSKKYTRRVLTQGLSNEIAVNHLLTLVPQIDENLFGKKVLRRAVDGDRVVMFVEDTSCDPDWRGDWQDDGCQRDKTRKYSRWVDAKSWTDWDLAAQFVRDKFLRESGGKFNGNQDIVSNLIDVRNGQRWVVIFVKDDNCSPGWVDPEWRREDCQADGTRRYTRKVDAKAMDWDEAANQLLNELPTTLLDGPIKDKKREKTASGIWGVVYVDNKTCFNYPGELTRETCTKVGKRLVSQKCENWTPTSDVSNQTLLACEPNKPEGSTVTIDGLNIVAKWELDDVACVPDWKTPGEAKDISLWTDRGCQPDGTKKYTRAVNLNGLTPEIGVGHMITQLPDDTLAGMKISRKEREGNNVAIFVDSDCFSYGKRETLQCLDSGRRQVRSECLNWPLDYTPRQAVSSCENKKPTDSKVTLIGDKVYAVWDIEDTTCTKIEQPGIISPTEEDVRPTPGIEVPVTEPVTEPVTKPVTEPVTKPVAKPVTEPVTKPVTEPVTEPVTKPVTEPVTEPVTKPVTEPVTKPVTEPVAKPVTEPVTKPVTEPVTKPVTEPVKPPAPVSQSRRREVISLVVLIVGLVLAVAMFKLVGVIGSVATIIVTIVFSGVVFYTLTTKKVNEA